MEKTKATIRGISSRTGKPFQTEVEFELYPPKDKKHYGTGYYMAAIYKDGFVDNVDVRYWMTTDLKALALTYISNMCGADLREVTFD